MTTYFDTSAIVKLVIDEPGSDDAAALWFGSAPPLTGLLAYPEARAAAAAAMRAGRLSRRAHAAAVTMTGTLIDQAVLVGVDDRLATHAGDLAERHHLRGYDAVHLACALAAGADLLVTWDRELAGAALACGCAIAPST